MLEESAISTNHITTWIPPIPGIGVVFYYQREHKIVLNDGQRDQKLPYGYILPHFRGSYTIRYRGGFAMLAVIFRPGQARKFLNIPYSAIVDRPTSFAELNLTECECLQEQLQNMSSNTERTHHVSQFFLNKLPQLSVEHDLLDEAIDVYEKNPLLPTELLADKLEVSSRHLRRLFKGNMGIGPKTFQKTVRFNRVLAMITHRQFKTLSEIAYRAGYYDHSHFDAEFMEFTGKRPSEFLLQHNRLIDAIHWRTKVENKKIIQINRPTIAVELEV